MRTITFNVPSELDTHMREDATVQMLLHAGIPIEDDTRVAYLIGIIVAEFLHRKRELLARRLIEVNQRLFAEEEKQEPN